MRPLIDFLRRYNYIFLFLLLEVVAVVMVAHSSYYQGSRITGWGNGIAGRWYSGLNSVNGYFGLRAENDRLAAENAALRNQLASSYISFSDSVFEVNDTVYKQHYSYIEAQVIKASWTQQNNYLMINKGRAQGVQVDQAVISPQGIVGVVVHTTESFATIMPVIHPDSRNSVKLQSSGKSGNLIWEGGDFRYATVTDVAQTHPVKAGDTVVTSGFANDFPEGILVGYVEEAESDHGSGFYKIKLRLATDMVNLSHVYIIDNRFREEQESLIQKTTQP